MTMWEVKSIDPRVQRRQRILMVLAVLALPMLVYGAYWKGGEDSRERIRQLEVLEQHYEQLTRELEHAQQMQAVLSSGERLGRQANEQSRQTIKLLEEQIYKLQQDLAFYKGVLAPASRREGLRIRSFELQGTDDPLLYRYKLLLSRVGTDDKALEGQVRISVVGKREGKEVELDLAELSSEWNSTTSFGFRHLQAFPEGARYAELRLPEDFVPDQIKVRADIKGQRQPLERTYNWNEEKK